MRRRQISGYGGLCGQQHERAININLLGLVSLAMAPKGPFFKADWSGRPDRVSDEQIKGAASYFPSIERKYGRPIPKWQGLVRGQLPKKHMAIVQFLRTSTA
jgi:hypothetical protein